MYILGLEASTSSAKAMLWEEARGVVDVLSAEYSPDFADVVTIGADEAVDAALRCGRALLEKNGMPKIAAIGLSSIWHSLLLLDGGGAPLTPVHTWADTAPAETVLRYRADGALSSKLYGISGCVIHSMYNLWKYIHMKESGLLPAGVSRLSGMGEYLSFRLTGEHFVASSLASGSGFLSLKTRRYDPEILAFAGIAEGMLPDPVEPGTALPLCAEAAEALGLPSGVPVAACGPDGGLNHLAAGGLGGSVMTLSVGTSGALRMGVKEPAVLEKPSTWCYYGGSGMYIAGAATSGAGNCVSWFAKSALNGAVPYKQLDAEAERRSIEAAPFFLPFLFGERSPGWSDSRRGGFALLDGAHDFGDMYYAVLEGVLFNLYQNYRTLSAVAESAPGQISVSGGITFSPFWLSMAADIFGVPLIENCHEHASLLGAVHVARKTAGALPELSAVVPGEGRVTLPDEKRRGLFARRFEQWAELYARG